MVRPERFELPAFWFVAWEAGNLSDINLPELIQVLSQTVYLRSVARRGHRCMTCRGGEYRHWFNWKALLCVWILKNFADSISR